jgi:hypothetical protein
MPRTNDMPKSRYELLDGNMQTMLAKLGELSTAVAVLTDRVQIMGAGFDKMAAHVEAQNGRVRKLEQRFAGIAAIGAFIGVAGKVLFDVFTKH